MKRYHSAIVGESHYSKPLTHRQKANGLERRYVSYNSYNLVMLGCMKHNLHKSLRAADKAACREGLEDIVLEPRHSHKSGRVRKPIIEQAQPEQVQRIGSYTFRPTTCKVFPATAKPVVEERKALSTAKGVPFFWLLLPLLVAVMAILIGGLLS